jgi:excisionase family DNA binding protein
MKTPRTTSAAPPRRVRYAEAAAYLGLTDRQIRRAVVTGQIAHSKLGLYVEFTQAQLDEFLAAHTYTPES